MKNFKLFGDFITLAQLLKELAIISTGGQAKWYLADHEVTVNGETEQRRGKKLRAGDIVKIGDQTIKIIGMAE